MPSAFTHAFVGASLLRLAPRHVPKLRLGLVLVAVSALPDLDALAFRLGIPYDHPLGHRGFSHSLLFAALAGLLAAGILRYAALRDSVVRSSVPADRYARWAVSLLLVVACASHGLLDAFTDAGLGIGFFIPFSDARYFFPFRPLATSPIGIRTFFGEAGLRVITSELLWIWLPIGVGLLVSWRGWGWGWRGYTRGPAGSGPA